MSSRLKSISAEATQKSVIQSVIRTKESTGSAPGSPCMATPEPTQISPQRVMERSAEVTLGSYDNISNDERKKKPTLAALMGEKSRSRRVTFVRKTKSVAVKTDQHVDITLKGEEEFLIEIEKNRHNRLERICFCPVTKWLLFKERWQVTSARLTRVLHGCNILCCPPLCYTLPRIAFWPPSRVYYFYREPEGMPKLYLGESIGSEEAQKMAERKKHHIKLKKATRDSMKITWRIGLSHPCAEEIEGVEAFVVATRRRNYLGCVRVRSHCSPRFYILYSHPNASDISDHLIGVPNMIDMARFYRCEIYSYDYSGFGISTGSPSERNQNADIEAVYKHMVEDRNIPPSRIVVLGYSIGTCASVHLVASLNLPVAGVILQAPPTSILRVLLWERACFGLPYKEQTCCADRFSTFDKIGLIAVPVLVIHGVDDDVVPISHGKIICERAINRVPPLWLRSNHDELENCREVWLRIRTFLKKELSGSPDKEKKLKKD